MAKQSLDEQWNSKEKQGREWNSKGYEMQGVELISEGKAERRNDMSCYGSERQNEAMAKSRYDMLWN